MRQHLATLVLGLLGGCSWIYNPDSLGKKDAQSIDSTVDAEIILDADPTMLEIDSVEPAVIFEGQGSGGSRSAVIAISGKQIVKDQTSVTVTVHPGQAKTATIMVDNTQLDVAADGDMLAVPITVPQDDNLLFSDQIRFDVTVTQNTVNGPVSKTLSSVGTADGPVLIVQGLAELRGVNATITPTNPQQVYSLVNLTGTISAPANTMVPIVVRATTTINIAGVSIFDASGATPGANGGGGGAAGSAGVTSGGPGGAGGGPGGGQTSGAVGKYVGDDQLTSMTGSDSSSGGAGGDGGTLSAGGAGGGGGGSVEITAGGTLTIGGVSAKGASGTTGANNGGAGSGGVVLLRAGGSVTVTSGVNVTGGTGPGAAADPGRVRIDAPNTITATTTPAAHYRGPTFATTTPMIVRNEAAPVTVINQAQRNFIYYINNADGSQAHGPISVLTPVSGMAMITLDAKLFRGVNQLCAIVDQAAAGTPEAGECIQIVYLYSP